MPRHHRLDEYDRPTDRSLLQDGYETPSTGIGMLRTALLIIVAEALVAGLSYFLFR